MVPGACPSHRVCVCWKSWCKPCQHMAQNYRQDFCCLCLWFYNGWQAEMGGGSDWLPRGVSWGYVAAIMVKCVVVFPLYLVEQNPREEHFVVFHWTVHFPWLRWLLGSTVGTKFCSHKHDMEPARDIQWHGLMFSYSQGMGIGCQKSLHCEFRLSAFYTLNAVWRCGCEYMVLRI